ncbi:MAG: hypothetical protein ACHBN1_32325 [Heteroscytonema crispum UTEX LB 1556]
MYKSELSLQKLHLQSNLVVVLHRKPQNPCLWVRAASGLLRLNNFGSMLVSAYVQEITVKFIPYDYQEHS